MDTNVAGLNKVYCFANNASYNGRTVTITDTVNTWSKTIDSLSCVFMIPSMPAPAKKTYTVSLMNSEGTAAQYSRQIELGFGDSVRIGLYENDEPVTKGTIPLASSSLIGGVKINDTTDNGIYLNGSYISLRNATSSQKGGVKVNDGTSSGLYVTNGTVGTRDASPTQSGCIKIGAGLNMSSGVASVKYADASNVGGIKIGQGLKMSSGVANVNYGFGLTIRNGYLESADTNYWWEELSVTERTVNAHDYETLEITDPCNHSSAEAVVSVAVMSGNNYRHNLIGTLRAKHSGTGISPDKLYVDIYNAGNSSSTFNKLEFLTRYH